jgi:antirestriction protein ArdC
MEYRAPERALVLPLRHNGTSYRGVNVISLWLQASLKGYTAPCWMTFKQALDLGGAVRKGEKGSLTVYADSLTRQETDGATGEENTREIHYLKGYTVFNVEQIDGLPLRALRMRATAPAVYRNQQFVS